MRWKVMYKLFEETNDVQIYVTADTLTQALSVAVSTDHKLTKAIWLRIEKI